MSEIKINSSYEKFLEKNQSNIGKFSPKAYSDDNYSKIAVEENARVLKPKLDGVYEDYQSIARVDSINFSKLNDQFKDMDETIAKKFNESGLYEVKK